MTESCVKSRLVEIGQRAVRIITDRAVERLLLAAFGQITGYKINSWSKNKIDGKTAVENDAGGLTGMKF